MGKKAKEHRKKVEARNQKIKSERKKFENMQYDLIRQIQNEAKKGIFDQSLPLIDVGSNPLGTNPLITEGPSI